MSTKLETTLLRVEQELDMLRTELENSHQRITNLLERVSTTISESEHARVIAKLRQPADGPVPPQPRAPAA